MGVACDVAWGWGGKHRCCSSGMTSLFFFPMGDGPSAREIESALRTRMPNRSHGVTVRVYTDTRNLLSPIWAKTRLHYGRDLITKAISVPSHHHPNSSQPQSNLQESKTPPTFFI